MAPELKFRCDVDGCDKSFFLKSMLSSHKRQTHPANPELLQMSNFVCEICGKAYKAKGTLKVTQN